MEPEDPSTPEDPSVEAFLDPFYNGESAKVQEALATG